ncbi:UNVERIFIED_CONTAM: SAP30-binding protein [Siphonaria sp. JEL0065]|nr:SAP30-binding protein [Siphonaria sp. JEL0065]
MNFLSYSSGSESDSESDNEFPVQPQRSSANDTLGSSAKPVSRSSPVEALPSAPIISAKASEPIPSVIKADIIVDVEAQEHQQLPQLQDVDHNNSEFRPIQIPGFVFKMPPEPTCECDAQLQSKVEKWTHLRRSSGRRFNDQLARTQSFGNPAIMSKLIDFLGLKEHGSNLDKAVFDPDAFPHGMFYDEIAKSQKIASERPPFSYTTNTATGQTAIMGGIAFSPPKVEASSVVTTASTATAVSNLSTSGSSGVKRSKWDQGGGTVDSDARKRK